MYTNKVAPSGTLFSFLNETPIELIRQDQQYVVAVRFSDGNIRFVGPFIPLQPDEAKAPHKDFSWYTGKFTEENSTQKTIMLPIAGRAIFHFCIEYALLEFSSKLKELMRTNVTNIATPEESFA